MKIFFFFKIVFQPSGKAMFFSLKSPVFPLVGKLEMFSLVGNWSLLVMKFDFTNSNANDFLTTTIKVPT